MQVQILLSQRGVDDPTLISRVEKSTECSDALAGA